MKAIKSFITKFLIIALITELFSCGYILYPERRGQKPGRIDYAVVFLDTLSLLFFIIPGVIAFTVDIKTGGIYLTNGIYDPFEEENPQKFSNKFPKENFSTQVQITLPPQQSLEKRKMQIIRIDPNHINSETIAAAIKESTGKVINLNDSNLRIYGNEEAARKFASK